MKVPGPHFHWAGLAAGGGLLLPVDRTAWKLSEEGLLLDDVRFLPKRELHITVLTRAQARALAERGMDATSLMRLAEGIDMRWQPTREAWRLRRVRNGAEAQSIVVCIAQPGQLRFRQRIATASDLDLGVPVPHVTLYAHGDPAGIALPDRTTFESLRVEKLDMRRLRPP